MASRKLLLRAARLLELHAEGIRQPCASEAEDWACGSCPSRDAKGVCETQKEHRKLVRTAKALREAA